MRTKKFLVYILSAMLILSVVMGTCGCSQIPFFGKDERTFEDFRREAAETSERVLRKILSGDYDTVKRYLKEDDLQYAKSVVNNMAPGIQYSTSIAIDEIFTETGSYDTEVHYRVTVFYDNQVYSVSFVMKLERSGNSWAISNAQVLFYDIQAMNEKYISEMKAKENGK